MRLGGQAGDTALDDKRNPFSRKGLAMASNIQQANLRGLATYLPAVGEARVEAFKQAYEENCHRIYALAFWMTDNELAAEELMKNTFCRAFASSPDPGTEMIDRALVRELRELMPLGTLTLVCGRANEVRSLRRNVKRVHLECAVVQLPPTERMIFLMHDVERYDHGRIARTLGINQQESALGLHQARLRMRELLATMV
jgi:RNA polymerase sigma-70 factor (ECF subfamily)